MKRNYSIAILLVFLILVTPVYSSWIPDILNGIKSISSIKPNINVNLTLNFQPNTTINIVPPVETASAGANRSTQSVCKVGEEKCNGNVRMRCSGYSWDTLETCQDKCEMSEMISLCATLAPPELTPTPVNTPPIWTPPPGDPHEMCMLQELNWNPYPNFFQKKGAEFACLSFIWKALIAVLVLILVIMTVLFEVKAAAVVVAAAVLLWTFFLR